jgi:hypothetical protein
MERIFISSLISHSSNQSGYMECDDFQIKWVDCCLFVAFQVAKSGVDIFVSLMEYVHCALLFGLLRLIAGCYLACFSPEGQI